MQLVLLIYNMTGASANSYIRNHVQIIISAYFFQAGYAHFYYLWHRSDAGIVRFFQVSSFSFKYKIIYIYSHLIPKIILINTNFGYCI